MDAEIRRRVIANARISTRSNYCTLGIDTSGATSACSALVGCEEIRGGLVAPAEFSIFLSIVHFLFLI